MCFLHTNCALYYFPILLYVLDADNFKIEYGKGGHYRILGKQNKITCEVEPRRIRKQVANSYAAVISNLPLPDCMRHGGYKSPDYSGLSGLRYNGPAATPSSLLKTILTWDMTPAFCLCTEDITHQEVRKTIQPALEINRKTMFGDMGIHLIPDANENL